MKRRLMCRLGRHSWRPQLTDDNQPYVACEHCNAVQGARQDPIVKAAYLPGPFPPSDTSSGAPSNEVTDVREVGRRLLETQLRSHVWTPATARSGLGI